MNRILVILLSLLLFIIPAMSGAEEAMTVHDLRVRFDLEKNLLLGRSQITLTTGSARTIHTGRLTVKSVSSSVGPLSFQQSGDAVIVNPGPGQNTLTIEYEAAFPPVALRGREDGIETAGLVAPEGIALTNAWYPSTDGLTRFNLAAVLPAGFEGISEADEIIVQVQQDGTRQFSFVFDHPVDSINLIAGRYEVRKEQHKAVEIAAYFFPEDREQSETYLAYTKKYLDLYEAMIGPFPFKRFSVVENILPTGYSMPTFTLLGRDVIRLPFIVETSLGHEVLHQWFGNSVYSDRMTGNWAEGLTTYLADHLYEDMKGTGWEYRKQVLVGYESYITDEQEISLKDFTSRTDKATSAVGYGKTAMVFHMLKETLGQDAFDRSLREFYASNKFSTASWAHLQKAFESVSGKDLEWFFKQWVEGKGALDFDIRDVLVRYDGSKARVSFEMTQRGRKDRFMLPVVLKTDKGEIRKTFAVEKESAAFEIETHDMPVELVIDEGYDLFRKLSYKEMAPVVSRLLGDKNRMLILPKGKDQDYKDLSGFLKERGFAEKKEEDLKHDDMKSSSFFMFSETALSRRLFADTEMPEGDFSLVMKQNPYNAKGVIGIIHATSAAGLQDYLRRITHYGKYSTLVFKDGRNTVKTIEKSDRGMRLTLEAEVKGVETTRITGATQVIEKVSSKGIVYVGELHDRFDHHRMQYRVIRELYGKNTKLAIGMEMFQKPFQKALDDYIAGAIDEKTFLKKSEYFKRWGFDYNLYREILLFAKEKSIPVIALNIRKEIVTKVSKEGLQALSGEDLKEVPEDLDLSDREYQDRLRGFFARHAGSESRSFDFFFQSQVLWDESMAHNLNEFMQKNPGYQVVVLAGAGHMAFGSGIPKRAFRLNKKEYAVILNSHDVEKDIADYLLYPSPVSFPESPKLGVFLKEEGVMVSISEFVPGGIAEQAGLKIGDVILSLDDDKVESLEDMKIHLLFRKKGDTVAVKVKRARFLLGDKEMEFKVVL